MTGGYGSFLSHGLRSSPSLLTSSPVTHSLSTPFGRETGMNDVRNRREKVTNGVNERRTWKRLTFPFPFVHHQSHDLKESCM